MKIEAAALAARTRRSLPPGGMQALQESMKEKQTKAKELREVRQKMIGFEHRYILTLVGMHIAVSNVLDVHVVGIGALCLYRT